MLKLLLRYFHLLNPYDPITVNLKDLKLPILNYEPIQIHGQWAQDLFVIAMTKGKQQGTYLEIGCGYPIDGGNNTYRLQESFNWSGTSIDSGRDQQRDKNAFRTLQQDWRDKRPNANFLDADALTIDYSGYPDYFDYLQVDIDPSKNSLTVLKRITEHINFSVITFEHDCTGKPSSDDISVRAESRIYLNKLGYVLVIPDIGGEDWWANPSFISEDVIRAYTQTDVSQRRTRCLLREDSNGSKASTRST